MRRRDLSFPVEGPPQEKSRERLGDAGCRKGCPRTICAPHPSGSGISKFSSLWGPEPGESGGYPTGRRWAPRTRRGAVLGSAPLRPGVVGEGTGAAVGSRARGGGARRRRRPPPLECAPLPSRPRPGTRAQPAEAGPLQGEAPTRRCAGSPIEQ